MINNDREYINSLLSEARKSISNEDESNAFEILDKVLEIDPENIAALRLKGRAYLAMNNCIGFAADNIMILGLQQNPFSDTPDSLRKALPLYSGTLALQCFDKILALKPQDVGAKKLKEKSLKFMKKYKYELMHDIDENAWNSEDNRIINKKILELQSKGYTPKEIADHLFDWR